VRRNGVTIWEKLQHARNGANDQIQKKGDEGQRRLPEWKNMTPVGRGGTRQALSQKYTPLGATSSSTAKKTFREKEEKNPAGREDGSQPALGPSKRPRKSRVKNEV